VASRLVLSSIELVSYLCSSLVDSFAYLVGSINFHYKYVPEKVLSPGKKHLAVH
jgi:hypothetical protein